MCAIFIVYMYIHLFCNKVLSHCPDSSCLLLLDLLKAMEAERCTFFGPLPLVYIPTVADRRRLSPIRDRKIRATKKKFANALWPTCAKCACEKADL